MNNSSTIHGHLRLQMQKRLIQNVKLQVARRGLLRVACSSQKQAADHQNSALWSRRQTMVATGSCLLGASACNLLPQQFAQAADAGGIINNSPTALGFESRVSEFTLSNGLHFVVLERHNAPVVSCHTHAKVGAFVEEPGGTGLAHLMEHMAFKGTTRVGSRDWPAEQAILQAQDEVFYELRTLQQETNTRTSSRSTRLQQLQEQLDQLKKAGEELVVPNALGSMLQEAGAVGLNAATSHDNTQYYVALPSNKLELWFALESERFQAPVLRQLYTEKEVINEERRARWGNNPLGKFTTEYLMQALDNPYRRPVIGYAEDFDAFGSHEVMAFYNRYYHPRNITISIVGDVDPSRVQLLAEKYFGSWSAAPGAVTLDSSLEQLASEPLPGPAAAIDRQVRVLPPVASGSARVAGVLAQPVARQVQSGNARLGDAGGISSGEFVQRTAAGPLLAVGYYRPTLTGRKGTALEVAADVLSGGRSSRLVKQLVMRNKCLSASCLPGYPGELHPGLALVSGVPQPGGNLQQMASLLQQQLDQLASDGPTASELARVKAGARAALLSALTSNSSMASILTSYHAVTGSWRGVLQELDDVESLTSTEVAGVASEVFGGGKRFTGLALPL